MFLLRNDRHHYLNARTGPNGHTGGFFRAVTLCAAVAVSLPAFAESAASSPAASESTTSTGATESVGAADSPASASIERGRYVANDLAMCVQCHSPRTQRGELLDDQLFLGAPLPVKSPYKRTARWAFTAPNLRNATGFTEDEFLMFLMTGIRPNGTEARSPMPPYRMNLGDAQAVYDYLKSF